LSLDFIGQSIKLTILVQSFKNNFLTSSLNNSIFSSQIAMPAAMQEWYSKSYFGYVLLAELFKEDVKKLFLNDWTNIVNLILWPIKSKDKISKVNRLNGSNKLSPIPASLFNNK
jgi:hypothetical protein